MSKLIISQQARADLNRIVAYIAGFNKEAAQAWRRRIREKFKPLMTFPEMGSQREDIRPGARLVFEGRYNILYRHDETAQQVIIVAIVEADRDLDTDDEA